MTSPHHEFEDLERRLRAGWQWSEHAPNVSEQDVAAWAESQCSSEHEPVEALLASDPQLRRAVIDLRLSGPPQADAASLELRRQIGHLMPTQPAIIGRIGMWAAAAAAAVLLAFGGWQLGAASESERSLQQDTLAYATFGLSDTGSEDNASFLTYAGSGKEAQQ